MAKKGRSPSLIAGSNGKPHATSAKKRRKCKRCNEVIVLGDSLFEIPQKSGGFSKKSPFCLDCFNEVIQQTEKDVAALKEELIKLKSSG